MDESVVSATSIDDLLSINGAALGVYLIEGKPILIALTGLTERVGHAVAIGHFEKLTSLEPFIEAETLDSAFEDLGRARMLAPSIVIAFASFIFRACKRFFLFFALSVTIGLLWEPGFEIFLFYHPHRRSDELIFGFYSLGSLLLSSVDLCLVYGVPLLYLVQAIFGPFTGEEAAPLVALAQAKEAWISWPKWKLNASLHPFLPLGAVYGILAITSTWGKHYEHRPSEIPFAEPMLSKAYGHRIGKYVVALLFVLILKCYTARKWRREEHRDTV